MPFSEKLWSRLPRAEIAALWLGSAGFLVWLTFECLFGVVEHAIPPHQMFGSTHVATAYLPVPFPQFPGELELEVLEDGRPLGPVVDEPETLYRRRDGAYAFELGGWGGSTVVYFTGTEGSIPRLHGRHYVVRYPRRQLPAAFVLLVVSWLVLPAAAVRLSRRLSSPSHESRESFRAAEWSILVICVVYSLFAVQACLHESSVPWLLAVATLAVPLFLAAHSARGCVRASWLPWLGAAVVWAIATAYGGSGYASPASAAGFVVASIAGLVVYTGLRGTLTHSGSCGWLLLVAAWLFAAALNLARQGGFDPAGTLAGLGLSPCATGLTTNPWTSKFTAHWLVVVAWCSLAAAAKYGRLRRRETLVAAAVGLVAVGVSGSRSAALAGLVSVVVAGTAARWPGTARRLLVGAIVAQVLFAPLIAGIPWTLRTASWGSGGPTPEVAVHDLGIRGGVWEFSRRLVLRHPFVGWGFDASAELPGADIPISEALGVEPEPGEQALSRHGAFAGGHPHNAPLLIWIDLGLVGALLAAGLLIATGRSIAVVERQRGVHASLLGLLAATATILGLNYPLWEPEVLSILWMSAVLAGCILPAPAVPRRVLVAHAAAALAILLTGTVALIQPRLSHWWTVENFRANGAALDADSGQLTAGGEDWELVYGEGLEAGAELVQQPGSPALIRGWVYGPPEAEASEAVLVFVGPELVGIVWPERATPELFLRVESRDVRALTAGFEVPVDSNHIDMNAPVTVVALRPGRALAVELPPLSRTPEQPTEAVAGGAGRSEPRWLPHRGAVASIAGSKAYKIPPSWPGRSASSECTEAAPPSWPSSSRASGCTSASRRTFCRPTSPIPVVTGSSGRSPRHTTCS